jgi:hypothetical protein
MLNVLHRLRAPVLLEMGNFLSKKIFSRQKVWLRLLQLLVVCHYSQAPPQLALSTTGQTKAPSAAIKPNEAQPSAAE